MVEAREEARKAKEEAAKAEENTISSIIGVCQKL